MARSKHTRPDAIRAASRVRAPYEPRGAGDPSTAYTLARLSKERGLVAERLPAAARGGDAPLPRVRVARPRPGCGHPATAAEIRRVLRFCGERCTYGLRSVELVRGAPAQAGAPLRCGALVVPGRVLLFDQPPAPWTLPGRLTATDAERLRRAGAIVEPAGAGLQTVVAWPGATLRDFMLFDVLLHEIGHHLIQQYGGKRRARLARTKDHEAFADRFARRCRLLYSPRGGADDSDSVEYPAP